MGMSQICTGAGDYFRTSKPHVARSHKDKGHRRLASSNYIDTENIIYMKSESMKIYLILLTFMRTPAPCS